MYVVCQSNTMTLYNIIMCVLKLLLVMVVNSTTYIIIVKLKLMLNPYKIIIIT